MATQLTLQMAASMQGATGLPCGAFDVHVTTVLRDGGGNASNAGLLTECRRWTRLAKRQLLEMRPSRHFARRSALLLCASSVISLLPVLLPFGDPFDVSPRGYRNNAGYFLWYCGVGWSSIFLTNALWGSRVLGTPPPGHLSSNALLLSLVVVLLTIAPVWLQYSFVRGRRRPGSRERMSSAEVAKAAAAAVGEPVWCAPQNGFPCTSWPQFGHEMLASAPH